MTNRQWLAEMDDRTLAKFLTCGVMVRMVNYHTDAILISIQDITRGYTSSTSGVEVWLSEEQQYHILGSDEE